MYIVGQTVLFNLDMTINDKRKTPNSKTTECTENLWHTGAAFSFYLLIQNWLVDLTEAFTEKQIPCISSLSVYIFN